MAITLFEYLNKVLETFNASNRDIEAITFDIGLTPTLDVDAYSTNRISFTVNRKVVKDDKKPVAIKGGK